MTAPRRPSDTPRSAWFRAYHALPPDVHARAAWVRDNPQPMLPPEEYRQTVFTLAEVLGRHASDGTLVITDAADDLESHLDDSAEYHALPDADQRSLADTAREILFRAYFAPALAASAAIRSRVQELASARRPRPEILIAAYRVANARLPAAEVETIVNAELAAFMVRVRSARGAA